MVNKKTGKHGVKSVKNLMSLGKLGVISILQAASKDGFQASDLLAPLGSQTFLQSLGHAIDDFAGVLPELGELDMWEGIELGQHAYACWMDIKTELDLAIASSRKLAA